MRLRPATVLLLLAPLVVAASRADDEKESRDKGKAILERRPTQQLAFGEPPKEWKARPAEGTKSFLCDYDLPAAEGDAEAPRVNALFFPLGFEDHRSKILGSWTKENGDALKLEDQTMETLLDGELERRPVEEAGTYTHSESRSRPSP